MLSLWHVRAQSVSRRRMRPFGRTQRSSATDGRTALHERSQYTLTHTIKQHNRAPCTLEKPAGFPGERYRRNPLEALRKWSAGVSTTRKLAIFLCGISLASCARFGTASPLPAQSLDDRASSSNTAFKLLYSFTGAPSGSGPTGLADFHGLLYGTTTGGGAKTDGSVFVRGLTGNVREIYSFQGGADGSQPEGSLVALGGVFYGTTEYGGAHNDGTVFEVSPSGNERVIYSFQGGTDGATPVLAGLVVVGGALYGTTNAGGDSSCHYQDITGCGTVFEVSTSGQERVVYRFKGKPDGACPSGPLTDLAGALYGTTNYGGTFNNGSVFKVTTGGVETRLYGFKGYPDGAMPYGGVTAYDGGLYGTTALGGAYDDSGTVFDVSAPGTEEVLHSFSGAPDGAVPYAGLTLDGSTFYGTTELGGSSSGACVGRGVVGCGTIFSITPAGVESVLLRFGGHTNGSNPWAPLTLGKDVLYGTTLEGGSTDNGTIFELSP